MTPDTSTATLLAAAGLNNVTAANTFVGAEDSASPHVPAVANFVLALRGPAGTPVLNTGKTTLWEVPLIILCRGAAHDPKEPKDRAEAVLRYLHRAVPAGTVGYLASVPFPTYQGQNALGCYRYQIDVLLRLEE